MNVPSDTKWMPDLLRNQARANPDRTFVRFKDRALTYGEFDARTDELAGGFAELGVGPGDVVSVFLPNCIEFLEAWWGILKAGGVLGPVNPAYTGTEASWVINHAESVAVVTNSAGASTLAGHEMANIRETVVIDGDLTLDALASRGSGTPNVTRELDDLAAILYTSGTTGSPKGAMLSHRNEIVNAAQAGELLPLGPGERIGMLLPLFHANAQVATTLVPMIVGLEVVMWERFSASTFWDTVNELEPVSISAVPTILAAVLAAENAPEGQTSLRYVICGAAPLSVEVLEAFQNRFGIRILEGYGLTETTCVSSINPFYGDRKAGSIGLPVRGQEMKIVNDQGERVSTGDFGEIVIRGTNVMQGYLKNEEATSESIRDGWLYTGDVGYVDEDGYFFIVDRSKDMIIRGGENIYPREIEEVLYAHGEILECAVIGVPHEVRGEEVLAIVVPKPGTELDPEQLATYAAERLAKYKLPREFVVRDELPKTPTGKISKGPLRDEFGSWAAERAKAAR
ncbi:MAG TPA: long-chain fatty acid--CoA ligase [Solirubrobacteraceae bacterium]